MLPPSKKAEYADRVNKILNYMPAQAIRKLMTNTVKINWYATFDLMQKKASETFKMHGKKSSNKVGGWWMGYGGGTGELNIDGDYEDGMDAAGIYAHEFGHAVDWKDGSSDDVDTGTIYSPSMDISDTTEWGKAFMAEISPGDGSNPLSFYAKTSPSEGFAEFARLAWSGRRPREIKEEFPMCWEVFENHGLVRKIVKVQ